MKCFSWVSHLFLMIFFISCSSFQMVKQSYLLALHGEAGKTEYSLITIQRQISYYEKKELSHRSIRNLAIRVRSEVESVDSQGMWVKNTTIEKEGQEDLHGFGFPELKETIRLKFNFQGKVLSVDKFEKDSIFYLPPIILPSTPIKRGDRWSDSFRWKNGNQIFVTAFMSEFLKADRRQGKDVLKIKLSAHTIWENSPKDFIFSSHSEGYYLWDLYRNNVVYSESEAQDILESKSKNTKVITQTTFISKSAEFEN